MHRDRIRERLRTQPFKPFAVVMADGRRFPVRHPEFVYLHPDRRTVYLVEEQTGMGHHLSQRLIIDLEFELDPEAEIPLPGKPADAGSA